MPLGLRTSSVAVTPACDSEMEAFAIILFGISHRESKRLVAQVADTVSSETRSRMMASIKGRDTKPEIVVRRYLHALGFRFRLHRKDLPGRPDIVLPKWNAVVLVHGCFWHRHSGCRYFRLPGSRTEFWRAKIESNVQRDSLNKEALRAEGWRVVVIWECALRNAAPDSLDKLRRFIEAKGRYLEIPPDPRSDQLDSAE